MHSRRELDSSSEYLATLGQRMNPALSWVPSGTSGYFWGPSGPFPSRMARTKWSLVPEPSPVSFQNAPNNSA